MEGVDSSCGCILSEFLGGVYVSNNSRYDTVVEFPYSYIKFDNLRFAKSVNIAAAGGRLDGTISNISMIKLRKYS